MPLTVTRKWRLKKRTEFLFYQFYFKAYISILFANVIDVLGKLSNKRVRPTRVWRTLEYAMTKEE